MTSSGIPVAGPLWSLRRRCRLLRYVRAEIGGGPIEGCFSSRWRVLRTETERSEEQYWILWLMPTQDHLSNATVFIVVETDPVGSPLPAFVEGVHPPGIWSLSEVHEARRRPPLRTFVQFLHARPAAETLAFGF